MRCSTWFKDILLLTLMTSFFFGIFLGSRNLSAPDELRYAEIPREMIVDNDYLIPKINGVKYFEKPPLFYWMQVAAIKTFGLNEWALRFTTALMGLIGVLATYLFSRYIYSRKTAWASALILASMALYFSMAHVITLDMTVSVFITISLYLFFCAIKKDRPIFLVLGFIPVAAAIMTKGLIGLIFPGMIMGLWLSVFKRWKKIAWLYFFSGLLICLLLVAPWHILVQLRAPEFFHFYFMEQQFLRYATPIANRSQPWYFYGIVILLGSFPWVFSLPKTLKYTFSTFRWKNRWQHENEVFLMIWILSVVLFFSASHSKLIPYILSALPPLAILIGGYWATHKKRWIKPCVNVYLLTNVVLIIALLNIQYFDNHTIKSLIFKAKPFITTNDDVVAYHGYHQDLPYYLARIITVNEAFDELSFGAKNGNTQAWMIDEEKFKRRWFSAKTVYVFISKKKYRAFQEQYHELTGSIVAEEGNNLVVVNHPTNEGHT
ncbi:MAG: glycosyltransferase family 39 protein [Gammaproteobacteria bacterium]|nr:glycosyltransferase family 39 protein [Gammaproteobacteria bacterium]